MPDYEEFIFAVGLFCCPWRSRPIANFYKKKFKTGGFQNEKGNYYGNY